MVLRTALTRRWLSLLAVVLVLMAGCVLLGLWQLGVARDEGRRQAVEAAPKLPVAPLAEVLAPHSAFPPAASSRRVTATGRYDGSGQVLVVDRRLDGRSGSWVITPLVVEGTGARIAVLRGFTTATSAPEPTTSGLVTVVGSLAPAEDPVSVSGLAPGRLAAVDLAALVNRWPGELYNAFVFAISESPEATLAVGGEIERVPPPASTPGLSLRNAAYAVQWWVFALFALWMWWKMVREDHRRRQAGDAADRAPAIPSGPPGPPRQLAPEPAGDARP